MQYRRTNGLRDLRSDPGIAGVALAPVDVARGEVGQRVDRCVVGDSRTVVVAAPEREQRGEVAACALPGDGDAFGIESSRCFLGHPGQDVLTILDPGRERMVRCESVRQADDHETAAFSEFTAHVVAELDPTGGESATMNKEVARRPWGGVRALVDARVDRAAAAFDVHVLGVDHRGDLARHEAGVLVGDPFCVGLCQERFHGGPDIEAWPVRSSRPIVHASVVPSACSTRDPPLGQFDPRTAICERTVLDDRLTSEVSFFAASVTHWT